MNPAGDPVRRLLDEGESLLGAGRGGEALLAFERILLQDAAHPEARRGLERARVAVTEAERLREAKLDEVERAFETGDLVGARKHLEDALAAGPGGPRGLALADRLDQRSGRISTAPSSATSDAALPEGARGPHWSRRAFVASCALGLAALTVGVAASWDELLRRLTRAPQPSQVLAPPTLGVPPASVAGRAVSDAQRRLEQGDPAGALAALERVRPEDALYPYAQQLRLQSEAARRGADGR